MKLIAIPKSLFRRIRRRPLVSGAIGTVIIILLVVLNRQSKPVPQTLSWYEAKTSDFLVSVVEGGTLEAVNEISIRSEVEGTARIIFIVPEGSYVKKGDLLVELDSSSSEDAVNLQQINVEKAQFLLVQSEQQLEIQKSVAESEIAAATLREEFAQSDLEKFNKGEALQAQRNAQIDITNVLASLQMAQEKLDWSEKLYKEGFETKGNLDKDRLTVSESRLKLEQMEKALWMVDTFDNPKRKRILVSALQEAKENLERVKLQNERKLAQYRADVESQKKTLQLNSDKLERDKKQLLATKIYAPAEGLVVYGSPGGGHFSSESMIEEGAVVRNRQEIIKLPDVSEMKLQVRIHESHINQIRLGQPAYVVLDSMPDQHYQGRVNRVAPLPDSQSRWGNPDLKVYATEIVITDRLPDVKPGVSARAEIMITNLTDVISVPIQAITTRKGKQVAFLASAPDEPVPVTVGLFNTKFIEVISGLKPGDHVLLAPPLDTQDKDLGGAIIADGDTSPAGATNLASLSPRAPGGNGWNADSSGRKEGVARSASTNSPEMLKRFDADGDGKLNDSELSALRHWAARHPPSTNAQGRILVN